MPSDALKQILEQVPANFADPAADYRAVRKMFAGFHGHPLRDDTGVEQRRLGGVDTGWYRNADCAGDDRVAFHCHGGAFVSCPLDDYHFYGEMIVRHAGLPTVMPDYRLAPEAPWPAAEEDCFAAYRGLLDSGVDASRVCLMGESCGGSLAFGVLQRARAEGLPLPGCFVSLCGWFDLSVPEPPPGGADPFLTAEWVRARAGEYLGGRLDPADPRVSPANADLTGMPPMYLQVAERDTMREGALRLAANAARAGVDVIMESWPGMVHGWHGLVNHGVPEAERAWARIAAYVDARLLRAGPV